MKTRSGIKTVKHVVISCMIAAVMVMSLSGCTGGESGSDKENISPSAANTEQNKSDTAGCYEAYTKVLNDNETGIRNYNWQTDSSETYTIINKSIALCDIDNNGIPELFFFTADSNYCYAELNVYTYINGTAVKLNYTYSDSATYQSGGKVSAFYDANAASGTKYVIYKSKEAGHMYIYASIGDETQFYRVNEYELKDGNRLEEVDELANDYSYAADCPESERDKFRQNGSSISSDDFAVKFEKALSSLGEPIIYCGHDDTSIWKRFNTSDALAMSYDEMKAYLSK
mgnify:FL=1